MAARQVGVRLSQAFFAIRRPLFLPDDTVIVSIHNICLIFVPVNDSVLLIPAASKRIRIVILVFRQPRPGQLARVNPLLNKNSSRYLLNFI